MTITFQTVTSPFTQPSVTFTPAAKPSEVRTDTIDALIEARDEALARGDVRAYRYAKRHIKAYFRYHAERFRDAAPFPITHDDHLANVAHQHRYHGRGDVERMTVGLQETSEWRPPAVRKMDAAAGVERVSYDVEMPWGTQSTNDWLSISQRNQLREDIDRDELPSDYELSSLAAAELYGCSVDALDRGMRAKTTNTYSGCE